MRRLALTGVLLVIYLVASMLLLQSADAAEAPEPLPPDLSAAAVGVQCPEAPAWLLPCAEGTPVESWGPTQADGSVDRDLQRRLYAETEQRSGATGAVQDALDSEPEADRGGVLGVLDDIEGAGQRAEEAVTGGVRDAVADSICPPRSAPGLQAPLGSLPALDPGMPLGEQSDYARYGMAGLYFTTYDVHCLSGTRAASGLASSINQAANSLDAMTLEVLTYAYSSQASQPAVDILPDAMSALRTSFWDPWFTVAIGGVGLLVIALGAVGRNGSMIRSAVNVIIVLGVVNFLLLQPTVITDVSRSMTRGVAASVSNGMTSLVGADRLPEQQRIPDGYSRLAQAAWLETSFCGDQGAVDAYAERLRAAQALDVVQMAEIRANPAAAAGITESAKADWLALGAEMEQSHPVAFGCWSGQGGDQLGGGIKHLVASIAAGGFQIILSGAIIVLEHLLVVGILVAVLWGAVLLLSAGLSGRYYGFLLTGLLGPAVLSSLSALTAVYYYALLSDPATAWWRALVSAVAFSIAALMSLRFFRGAVVGVAATTAVTSATRKTRSTARKARRSWGSTPQAPSPAPGAAAGAAAGAAGAVAVSKQTSGGAPGSAPGSTSVPAEPEVREAAPFVSGLQGSAPEGPVTLLDDEARPEVRDTLAWVSIREDGTVVRPLEDYRYDPDRGVTTTPTGLEVAGTAEQARAFDAMADRLAPWRQEPVGGFHGGRSE